MINFGMETSRSEERKTGSTYTCYCGSAEQPGTAKGSCYKSRYPWERPHLRQP